jgi:5-methylcytosine-specific restriction enzyme A
MPSRNPTVCRCGVTGCEEHKAKPTTYTDRPPNRRYDAERPSSHKRGYDVTWQRVRKQKLSRDPLCESCMGEDRITAADEVHHDKPVRTHPELRLNLANLISLCGPCHRKVEGRRRRRNGRIGEGTSNR